MKLISIDPGYDRCGVAIIEKTKQQNKGVLIFSGCLETNSKDIFTDRLFYIGDSLEKIIKKESPPGLAIEKLFFNTNQKTATNVAEVRGTILYIAKKHNLEIYEYTPLEIKVATTGYGRSTKSQMISMIPHLIQIDKKITKDDEWDAIAVGLTCFAHEKFS